MRWFEILLAHVLNDRGQRRLFSTVGVEADRECLQLEGVLRGLGATSSTPITVLTDGAEGPRSLGEAASPGPTCHVLDWFHLSMRVQHVAQTTRSWPSTTDKDRQRGVLFAETIERIRWRLWHGQVQRALNLIGDTLEQLNKGRLGLTSAFVVRLMSVLSDLETYVSGHADSIINYAAASAIGETNLDSHDGEHGATAHSPADDREAADALVSARCPPGAEGQNRGHECDISVRSHQGRALGTPSVSPSSVSTPRFATVSDILGGNLQNTE